jgi:acyl carrier protein
MQKQEFINLILNELGESGTEANENTKLKSLEVWDSMASLVLISIVDSNFSVELSSEQIDEFDTFKDVIDAVGVDKFN